jgi:hypothetical protein
MIMELIWWKDSQSNSWYFDRQEMALKYTWCPVIQGSRLWYCPLSGGAKFREGLAVSKQITHRFCVKRFSLENLNE